MVSQAFFGVQTFMRVVDGCLTTEQPTRYPLLEQILQSSGWDDPGGLNEVALLLLIAVEPS